MKHSRIKDGELIGIKTNKSGMMGVGMPMLQELSTEVGAHTSARLKMLSVG